MTLHEPDWFDARLAAACGAALAAQTVALPLADRRVLAADARALTDLPAYPTSAMDGWAVAGPGPWRLIGTVLAGRAPEVVLHPGQACVIATGAAVPDGATAVVRREDGTVASGSLSAPAPAPGTDIRPRGEECRTGDVLARAGSTVTPAHVGMFAAAGLDAIEVRPRVRAAIVLFGDELTESGVAGVGQVRDSLGPQLPGWLERLGALTVSVARAADTLEDHIAAITAARTDADMVITTGGTAAGPVDHLHPAVAALGGAFVIDSVAVRPGHPMALADLGEEAGAARWLLGLPGNPLSAVVSLLTLGAPLIDSLLGRALAPLSTVELTHGTKAPDREHRLVACTIREARATPVAHLGSAMLRGLAAADGFAVLPPGGAAAGQRVPLLPLPA